MNLPKELTRKRDELISNYNFKVSDNKQIGKDFYAAAVEDMIRESQSLLKAISQWKIQVDTHGGDYLPGNYNQISQSLKEWQDKFGTV